MSDEPALETLRQAVADYLEFVETDYHPDRNERYENRVFEAAVELFHGEGVWDRVNAAIEAHDE